MRKVILFPDVYTNYINPKPGKAAIHVLEAVGVYVSVLDDLISSGRPAYSKGYLDIVRKYAETNVDRLAPLIKDGWDIISVEPSDTVMFQDEYTYMLSGDDVRLVSSNTYGICEYLDKFGDELTLEFNKSGEKLTYHGNCLQKAINKAHHTVNVLRKAGYEVDFLDSSCCGMAGFFGYETEHYDLSKAIGQILFTQIDQSGGVLVTPGASCRTQLGDHYRERILHPIKKIEDALVG